MVMENKFSNFLRDKMDAAHDIVDAARDKFSHWKEASAEKADALLDEVVAAGPVLEQAGYAISAIELSIGIPPEIQIGFQRIGVVAPEEIGALAEAHSDQKTLALLLKALQTAARLQGKITLNAFAFAGISIRIGLTPGVTLHYEPVHPVKEIAAPEIPASTPPA